LVERIVGTNSRSARLIRPARRLNLITCVHKRSRTPVNKFLFVCREQLGIGIFLTASYRRNCADNNRRLWAGRKERRE